MFVPHSINEKFGYIEAEEPVTEEFKQTILEFVGARTVRQHEIVWAGFTKKRYRLVANALCELVREGKLVHRIENQEWVVAGA